MKVADREEAEKIKNTLISKGYYNLYYLDEHLVIEGIF